MEREDETDSEAAETGTAWCCAAISCPAVAVGWCRAAAEAAAVAATTWPQEGAPARGMTAAAVRSGSSAARSSTRDRLQASSESTAAGAPRGAVCQVAGTSICRLLLHAGCTGLVSRTWCKKKKKGFENVIIL